MLKSKDILNKLQKYNNIHTFSHIVMLCAGIMTIVAICVLIFCKPVRNIVFPTECKTIVEVKAGDTLSNLLCAEGFSISDVDTIAKRLKKDVNFTTLRAGTDKIEFIKPSENESVSKIIIVNGPWHKVELQCNEIGEWQCNSIDIAKDVRIAYRESEILDGDSFYTSGMRAGIPAGILADVYDLLAFEMDFERDVRAGQKFFVLYEENYAGREKIDTGHVLAISFESLRGNVKMYRFKKLDGQYGYYDADGNGAIKSLKRTPINNAKVTSSFSNKRKHPVLGFTRAHKGVDFRASTGTPIPAAGAGRVVARSYNKGHGNYVKIRHNGTYETLYGHMSRFAKGVTVGTSVRQGQTIGYVGSTGLSTGPHLHYEIIKNGKHVNPMKVKLPAINNLGSADKKVFKEYLLRINGIIDTLKCDSKQIIRL